MRITWIQALKMLKAILSTWKSPINVSRYYFYNYFLIFMLIPLFLRWEIEARKCILTVPSHISQFFHTDTAPTRQADPLCISYSGSPITCTFNLCKFYYKKGWGMEGAREREECNSNNVGDAIQIYTQHMCMCTLCKWGDTNQLFT